MEQTKDNSVDAPSTSTSKLRFNLSRYSKYRQPVAWFLVVIWAAGIFFVSNQPSSSLPENLGLWSVVGHFCEYWVLAVLIVGALDMPWRRSWKTAVAAMVIASLYGITDEFHQSFIAGRVCETIDWIIDTAGGTLGSLAGTWVLTAVRLYRK